MSGRGQWILAVVLSLLLVLLLVPFDVLTDFQAWRSALNGHSWIDYLEAALYLAGILLVALLFGLALNSLLNVIPGTGWAVRTVRYLVETLALGGLSPLQPVLATALFLYLVSWLATSGLVSLDNLSHVLAWIMVLLFGTTLGAELALRRVDVASSALPWYRQFAIVVGEQAPALAGRLAIMVMAGAFLSAGIFRSFSTDAGLGTVPAGLSPYDGIIAALIFTLVALIIWIVTSSIAGSPVRLLGVRREREERLGLDRRLSPIQWGIPSLVVALVVLVPLVLTLFAGDPLAQDLMGAATSPSDENRFGTDELGRDFEARLIYAWRDVTLVGIVTGITLSAVMFAASFFVRPVQRVRAVLELIPPPVLFFVAWGLAFASVDIAWSLEVVGFAVGVVLLPQALAFGQLTGQRLFGASMSLAMLSILLVLGWSAVIGQVGYLSPGTPDFGNALIFARQGIDSAPWLRDGLIVYLGIATTLGLLALSLISRAFKLPRRLTRLRG